MAEFCLACWNRLNGIAEPAENYIRSLRRERCEGCGGWERVIVYRRDDLPRLWEGRRRTSAPSGGGTAEPTPTGL